MSATGFYPQVFFESAWIASILPMGSEPTFFAMKAFGGFDMRLAFLPALAGAIVVQLCNWLIGKMLLDLKKRGSVKIKDEWYERARYAFIRYGVFILFFCWVPLLNVCVIAAGFLGVRLRMVLPLVVLGEAFNYGRFVF